MNVFSKFLLPMLVLAFAAPCLAKKPSGEDGGRKKRRPPQEAFKACADLSESDACSFTGKRGDASGVCAMTPKGDKLVCKPDRG